MGNYPNLLKIPIINESPEQFGKVTKDHISAEVTEMVQGY